MNQDVYIYKIPTTESVAHLSRITEVSYSVEGIRFLITAAASEQSIYHVALKIYFKKSQIILICLAKRGHKPFISSEMASS